ncbi:MAG: hypothetical protein NC390_02550 [Fusobacterium sp.]|nr:hypothetical protein [Fusobacterium sp.]
MNLAVTPVKFNNYSATQNCKKNNSQQNFEAIPAKLLTHASESAEAMLNTSTVRKRDMLIDGFLAALEHTAKEIGFDTEKLATKGYMLEFRPNATYSTSMTAFLTKDGSTIRNNKSCPVFARVQNGKELIQGQKFAHDMKGLNLDLNV